MISGDIGLRLAVIGAGITGLGAAWLLSQKHHVSLFESEPRLGGHADTAMVAAPDDQAGDACAIDTGFIVYNTACYPNLIALFATLDVPTAETSMSFAVSLDDRRYEYSGSGLGGLFGQPRNLLSPPHWRMAQEIFRFFKQASALDAKNLPLDVSLGDWLKQHGYSKRFIHAHIVPMGAAIWSTPANEMLGFPFASFARFFENHGLLQTFNRPAWRTVRGGSKEYVARVRAALNGPVMMGDRVVAVAPMESAEKSAARVTLASGHSEVFDGVLIACHGDDARGLLQAGGGDSGVIDLLANFRYAHNDAVLHRDPTHMPKRRRLWSSWNYLSSSSPDGDSDGGSGGGGTETGGATSSHDLAVSYWMNCLQPLATKTDYFVTLNPSQPIADHLVDRRVAYTHPMFDENAMAAQLKLWPMQGRNSVWLAGSYLGFGFHEDGLQAGLAAAEDMSLRLLGEGGKVVRPWAFDKTQGRIAINQVRPDDVSALGKAAVNTTANSGKRRVAV